MLSLLGGAIGGIFGMFGAMQNQKEQKKWRRMFEAYYAWQRKSYDAQVVRIEKAETEEKGRISKYEEAQSERWAPYRGAYESAIEKLRGAAEAPEMSDYAKLQTKAMEESVNKELAKRGILFSGAAAKLKAEGSERIAASEAEKAKGLMMFLTKAAPMEPGFIGGPFYGNPNIPGPTGGGGGGGGTDWGQAINPMLAGLYGYQKEKGYNDYDDYSGLYGNDYNTGD